MIDVEFEWFNFDPEVDFHGTKTLMRQLFDVDASLFNMSALADLILSQPTVGSTIKVDGKATDAYAMLTAINTQVHREKEPIKDIVKYLGDKAKNNPSLAPVAEVLASDKHVGLVLSERLINMPVELGPPMYGMLVDEIEAAVEDKEPYEFSHYLVVSRAYTEVESTLDVGERKAKKAKEDNTTYYFHVEDETLHKYATAQGNFSYTKEDETTSDSKRAFQDAGIKTCGHLVLIEAAKFGAAVKSIREQFQPPQ